MYVYLIKFQTRLLIAGYKNKIAYKNDWRAFSAFHLVKSSTWPKFIISLQTYDHKNINFIAFDILKFCKVAFGLILEFKFNYLCRVLVLSSKHIFVLYIY